MCDFSDKYNIKINSTDNIVNVLSNFDGIIYTDNFNISELYFIKKTIDITKIENFNDITDYAVITKEGDKKYIKIYNKEIYQTTLDDILLVSKLLLLFDYEVLFSNVRDIYKYSYNNIKFYVQFINNKTYVLSFDKNTSKEYITTIINLFKHSLNIDLDVKFYFDIKEQLFLELKK